jgi:hypothetical protein
MRYLVILALCFLGLQAAAQTTETEFNYVNNGLLEDLQKGREVKTGYSLVATGVAYQTSFPDGSWRKAEIFYFKARAGNKNKSLVIKCTDSFNNVRYICVPTSNSGTDMWFQTEKALHETGAPWNTVIMCAFAKLAAQKAL